MKSHLRSLAASAGELTRAVALAMALLLGQSNSAVNAQAQTNAPAASRTGTVIEKFDDWSLFSDGAQKTVCFIAATPTADAKAAKSAQGVVLYVSAWPKEGVKAEISVKLAQKLKKGSEVSLAVGTTSFKMFVKDDKAFVDDPTRELKLIDAMKKGARIVLHVPAEAGSDSGPETFSLSGFGQALQALSTRCP